MTRSGRREPLSKAFQLLELLSERPAGAGVREIAECLGMPPATVHRTLRLLQAEDMVTREDANGRYRLDFRLYRLGWTVAAKHPITAAALPIMRDLVDEVDETTFLALYDPSRMEMIIAARVESSHSLQYLVELNQWLPVYAGAGGLGIMSFLPEAERQKIIRRTGLKPLTALTIAESDELERAMEQFRAQGYVMTAGQRVPGAVGLSAPVWGPAGGVVGDLVVTVPEHRFAASREPELAASLITFADCLTAAINGKKGPSFTAPKDAGRVGIA